MKKFVIFFCLLSIKCFSQIGDETTIALLTKKYKQFIPKKYLLMDTATSDFNFDGKIDIVLVVKPSSDTTEEYNDISRGIIILKNSGSFYTKEVENLKAIQCEGCGGIYGDPYSGISFQKNVLKLNHYGGSAIRWSYIVTFRYQQKTWKLIGINAFSYRNNGCKEDCDISMCELQEKDFNISTQKIRTIETDEGSCKPKKEYWKKVKSFPFITLTTFDINKDYFKAIKY